MNEHIFYKNLESVPILFRDYVFKFIPLLREKFKENLISIVLFGSVARRNYSQNSDIDLFIILSNEYSENIIVSETITDLIIEFQEKNSLKSLDGKDISPSIQVLSLLIKDLNTFRTIYYDLAVDGLILYDPKNTGSEFINCIKKRIEEKELKRVYINQNDFYWKRKDIKFGEIIEL